MKRENWSIKSKAYSKLIVLECVYVYKLWLKHLFIIDISSYSNYVNDFEQSLYMNTGSGSDVFATVLCISVLCSSVHLGTWNMAFITYLRPQLNWVNFHLLCICTSHKHFRGNHLNVLNNTPQKKWQSLTLVC